MRARAAIIGASGYIGGELLRLLLMHPEVEVVQATSRSHVGRYVHSVHPNLRGVTDLRFVSPEEAAPCDVLFCALPHGRLGDRIEQFMDLAPCLIDTSADFRLHDPQVYQTWYGRPHPAPERLGDFTYGLVERHRSELQKARCASGVGCNATVLNLALGPLADAGMLERAAVEIKVGSSEAGAAVNAGSHHPERSGAVRTYSITGHRHLAEVEQELGPVPVHLAVTAIEMVRGVHLTAHCFLAPDASITSERDLWALYRAAYGKEPFIRLVSGRRGLYRYPEPKILAGTNYCDIGFAYDEIAHQVVVIAALDNLVKGGAGSAVQAMNVMHSWDETCGLSFPGLHPI